MIWKVPVGYYRKNILKFYGMFTAIFAVMGTIGWFVKESYGIDETPAVAATFIISAGLQILLAPIVFQKGIVKFVREYEAAKQENKDKPVK